MTDLLRWTAKITWRMTHDTFRVETFEFEEFEDLDEHIESGPNFYAIEKIEITLNLDHLKTTLIQETIDAREPILSVVQDETPLEVK